MKHPLAILLDLDGTLVDSETVGMQALKEASTKVLGQPFEEERFQRFLGRSETSFFGEMAEELGTEPVAEIKALYHAEYLPLLAKLPMLPGALKWVARLSKKAPTMIVSGSNRQQIATFIEANKLKPYITSFIGCEDYRKGKPAPECFRKAAEALALEPKECLVFEDSDVGVQAAKSANCRVIGLRCGNPEGRYSLKGADLILESFEDLSDDEIWV